MNEKDGSGRKCRRGKKDPRRGQERPQESQDRGAKTKGQKVSQDSRRASKAGPGRQKDALRYDKTGLYGRPRWTPPQINTEPLPSPDCIHCGQPVTDIHSALMDKKTGGPIHFDCAIAVLSGRETLEAGDVISYIGGGRFGIVRFNAGKGEPGKFTIKKILEWEDKENRAEWRGIVADHYSVT